MSQQDEEFLRRLKATFNVEAREHVAAMSSALLELEKSPAPAAALGFIERIYREAHSLKGAARAVDQSDIEATCQQLESVFAVWKRQPPAPSPEQFDMLHQCLDVIQMWLDLPDSSSDANRTRQRDELNQRIRQLLPAFARPGAAADLPPQSIGMPLPPEFERSTMSETVRIAAAKLDAHLLQAQELLSAKFALAHRGDELRQITASMDHWKNQWARVRATKDSAGKPFQPKTSDRPANAPSAVTDFLEWNGGFLRSLETRISALRDACEQDRRTLDGQIDQLLEDSRKLLMLPFSDLAAILPKLVRDLARDQGKQVELTIEGGEIQIDKRILEEMKDALIHILRNSVDHGVEMPEERARLGKPPRATVAVAAAQVNGSKVQIRVTDDGAGVDIERLKAAAVRRGVISESVANALSDADAIGLVYHSDVSTSPIVTEISGRGLGMTIVRAKIEKMGGTLSFESQRHGGTTLRMLLPLKLATFRGVFVSCADQLFIAPTTHVQRVLRVAPKDVRSVENRPTISLDGQPVSLVRLDRALELSQPSQRSADETMLPVIVLHSGDSRIAFAVDEILYEQEVLVKPLRKPLVRVRNIAGAAVLASGKTAAVLQVSDLLKSARNAGAFLVASPNSERTAAVQPKRVLVVEDSITSRMLLKGVLESAGYEVKTAVDGMEGFATLCEEPFDLVVSDVEMPRLNGFDLAARIRADARLKELPVVLVTALESRQERERGIDAGASAYIIKSSFDQDNLLKIIARLI